jgi:DNA-directed RNA polymerase subunit beta
MKLSYAISTKAGDTVIAAGQEDHQLASWANSPEVQGRAVESRPTTSKAPTPSPTSSTCPPAKSSSKPIRKLTPPSIGRFIDAGIESFEIFFPERDEAGNVLSPPSKRTRQEQNEALLEIYRKLRPGDPPTLDTATQLFHGMFFDPRKYDFSRVGRMKFNIKLYDNAGATPLDKRPQRSITKRLHRYHQVPAQAPQGHRRGG